MRSIIKTLKRKGGSALLLVLGCVALMTLLVIAFLGSSLTERSTSDLYAKQVSSKLLAENAINLVVSQLKTATKSVSAQNPGTTVAWASQPGMIRAYNAAGNADSYYKLYSWDTMTAKGAFNPNSDIPDATWAQESDLFTDLNEPVNGRNPIISSTDSKGNPLASLTIAGHAGVLSYDSNATGKPDVEGFYIDPTLAPGGASNPVAMPVKWLYMLADGTIVPPVSNGTSGAKIAGASAANPITGRIAFWTDDETAKVNINTASEGSSWDIPSTFATEDEGTYDTSNFAIAPYGLSTAVPTAAEYQRIPGHPATTCLSTVLGSVLPLPTPPLTEATFDSSLAPYYTLAPRYAPGGSKAGTRPSYDSSNAAAYATPNLTPPAYRLYTSLDELLFDPQRTPLPTANANLYPATLNGTTQTGISPTGRPSLAITPAALGETQFFLTADSKAPEETLFDTPRLSLWPLQTDKTNARNAVDNVLAFCSTVNTWPYFFQRLNFYASSTKFTTTYSFNDSAVDLGGTVTGTGVVNPGSPQSATSLLDGNVKRNQNLMAYLQALTSKSIPGFGGNFLTKYPAATSGISDRDQILVDMFDLIRSSVNTYSLGYSPQYSFTAMQTNGNAGAAGGSGSAFPIQMKDSGGHILMGLGRSTTIAEVAIVFMATKFLDQTTLNLTSPYTPTAGADGVPDDVPNSSGQYDGYGDPQTTEMQAFLVIRPYGVTPSTTSVNTNFRYKVSGLDSLTVNFSGGTGPIAGSPNANTSLGFPAAANAVDIVNINNLGSRSGLGFGFVPLTAPCPDWFSSTPRLPGISNGDFTATGPPPTGPNQQIYPFIGGKIALPAPAHPSAFGGSDGAQLLRSGMTPNTFSFSGGNISISILSGFPLKTSTSSLIQTVNLSFPPIASLPIPSYARANAVEPYADGNPNAPAGHTTAFTDQTKLEFYEQTDAYGSPTGSWRDYQIFANRIGTEGQYGYDFTPLIQRGDTVRSLVPNAQSIIRGDLRIIANLPTVPIALPGDSQNVYSLLGNIQTNDCSGSSLNPAGAASTSPISSNYTQFHSLFLDGGNFLNALCRVNSNPGAAPYDTAPVNWPWYGGDTGHGGQGLTGGALFGPPYTTPQAVYNNSAAPHVTPELTTAEMVVGGNKYAGDWSNGYGNNADGPLVSSPDEGFQVDRKAGYASPYYETAGGSVVGSNNALVSESFSPNRQIASSVCFGTLPSGVQAGQGWRTLLFCPNPNAGSNHPGFGAGSGTQGPGDYPPYTTPPDHLLLDLFWMPIVEPYAISEPLATAGKINLNYQIVPFNFIHRSTGVRAVMKATNLLAIPATASTTQANSGTSPQYKSPAYHMSNPSAAQNANYRYNINLDATVDASDSPFQTKFTTQKDLFRSASEICNVFLVPKAIPGSAYTGAGATVPANYTATPAWWNNFQLTGDNNRESPYNQLYPRLTTKSNTFQVHFRVQTLVKPPANDPTVFDSTKGDTIGGEYRGSAIVERYIDPNDTTLPDFAAGANSFTAAGTTLDNYYHWRVVRTKSFTP